VRAELTEHGVDEPDTGGRLRVHNEVDTGLGEVVEVGGVE